MYTIEFCGKVLEAPHVTVEEIADHFANVKPNGSLHKLHVRYTDPRDKRENISVHAMVDFAACAGDLRSAIRSAAQWALSDIGQIRRNAFLLSTIK